MLFRSTKTSNYRAPKLSTPEKASLIDRSVGSNITISHLDPSGKETEYWVLHNPMITKFSWGSLDYASDELVEYSFTITYDWATWSEGSPITDTAKPPVNERKLGGGFGNITDGLENNPESNYGEKYYGNSEK